MARAGTLLALALVFRLARRLVGPGWQGVTAGLVAAAALACTPQWLRYAAHGNEAPLAVAAMLWAVERHLDGSRRAALALGLVACLMRPEVFPFLALYAVWAWRAEPATRRVIVAGAVVLPLLWLVPEWIGSGQPFGAGAQARSEPSWSLSRLDHPWLELLGRAHQTLGPALEAGVAAALVIAWRRRDRIELALAGVVVAWVALVAAMTQSGFSGNARYLLPATVVACLLTGTALGHLLRSGRRSVPAAVAAVALAALAVSAATERVPALERQARTAQRTAQLDRDLGVAVARMGGADAVVARGAPAVDRAFIPRMAWLTTLPIGQVERRSVAARAWCSPRDGGTRSRWSRRPRPRPRSPAASWSGAGGSTSGASAGLDELDPVPVRIADEADPAAALAHLVGRLLGLDALAGKALERPVQVLDGHGDVVVAGAHLVRVDAVVVGQLQPRAVAGEAHEHVDGLVADGHPPELLEAQLLVEGDRLVDVADAVTGVDQLAHAR